jgi:hypothetical protein
MTSPSDCLKATPATIVLQLPADGDGANHIIVGAPAIQIYKSRAATTSFLASFTGTNVVKCPTAGRATGTLTYTLLITYSNGKTDTETIVVNACAASDSLQSLQLALDRVAKIELSATSSATAADAGKLVEFFTNGIGTTFCSNCSAPKKQRKCQCGC